MTKLTLNIESLAVETFTTGPELAEDHAALWQEMISRKSCIEQCTTSCVP